MVGLPARGKTYLAYKLNYYLNWIKMRSKGRKSGSKYHSLGIDSNLHASLHLCSVFNLGVYRRQLRVMKGEVAQYYNPENKETRDERHKIAVKALDDLFRFFRHGGDVGVRVKAFSYCGRGRCGLDTFCSLILIFFLNLEIDIRCYQLH